MNQSPDSIVDDIAFERVCRLERLCSQFEAAWKSGNPPRLSDYIDAVPADERPDLLRELLSLDKYYRRNADDELTVAEYVARHPEHDETIRAHFRSGDDSAEDWRPRAAAASPGTTLPLIAGYTLERELGRGGMGVVFLARDDRLRRQVVLKMIRDAVLSHPNVGRRFQIEAEAVARLQHPNIVQVYAVGEADGRPYMALEYVAGGSLDRLLARKPISARAAVRMMEIVARAVQFAHQNGVIHRDLKPANILLQNPSGDENHAATPTPEAATPGINKLCTTTPAEVPDPWPLSAVPKVGDFGLAKMMEGEPGMPSPTISGDTLGTPSYMAPEQARARISEIGPATDVYALGAILYELLTGRPPFLAATPISTLDQVLKLDPLPPRQLQPGVPRDLETICLKCLEKSPNRRYPSANDFAEDLRRFRVGEPIRARPVGSAEHAWRWARRHPSAAVLIVTLFFGLAVMTGLLVRLAVAQRNEQAAKNKSDRSLEQAQDAVRKTLVFLAKDDELAKKGLFDLQLQVLSAITEQAERIREQNDDKLLMAPELGAAYLQIATLQQHLGQLSKTAASLKSALDLYRILAANDPSDIRCRVGLASCLSARGTYHRNEYRITEALADFQQSTSELQDVIREHPDERAARIELVEALIGSGEVKQQIALNPFGRANSLTEYAQAEAFYRRALAECTRLQATDDSMTIVEATCHLGISESLTKRDGPSGAAIDDVRRADRLLRSLAAKQVDDVTQRAEITAGLVRLGKQAVACELGPEAKPCFDQAIAISERLCHEFPNAQNYRFELANAHYGRAELYRSLDQRGDEAAARQSSLEHIDRLASASPIRVSIRTRLTVLSMYRYHIAYLIRVRRLDEAMQCIDRADQVFGLVYGSGGPSVLYDNEQTDRAKDRVKEANNRWQGDLAKDRAQVHDAAGRFRESVAAWDESLALHAIYRTHKLVGRCLALAGAGSHEQATLQAAEVASEKDLTEVDFYDLARTYSRCCHGAMPTDRREEFGRTAVEFLKTASAMRFFKTPDQIELLSRDPDLAPLRGRNDFETLLRNVTTAKAR